MLWNQLLNPGRMRQSSVTSDFRSEFERDYDRVVFSTPLRRLQDKTQVFPLEQHDAIRTRLTHTIEVSTVARTLAQGVARRLVEQDELSPEQAADVETIAATCGLLHDFGNPPFGHAGEQAIRDWFEDILANRVDLVSALGGRGSQHSQDLLLFDGNAQTIRLLTRLQVLGHRSGLNLAYGTLSAALKYVVPSDRIDRNFQERKKVGFFASEGDLVEQVQTTTSTGQCRNPITYLVEAADDTVFSTVDLEDGIKKGILSWESLERTLCELLDEFIRQVIDETKRLAKAVAVDEETFQETHGQAFRIAAIRALVPAVAEAFDQKYTEIMRGHFHGNLLVLCPRNMFTKSPDLLED